MEHPTLNKKIEKKFSNNLLGQCKKIISIMIWKPSNLTSILPNNIDIENHILVEIFLQNRNMYPVAWKS